MVAASSLRELGTPAGSADAEEAEPPPRTSFFAEPGSARVDELVCATVWRIFIRDSVERGFEKRKSTDEEDAVSELQEAVKESHAGLLEQLGRPPSIRELFAEVGKDVGRSPANVRMCAKRVGLELTSLRGGGGEKAAAPPSKARTPRARRTSNSNGANGHARANGVTSRVDEDAPPPPSGGAGAYLAIIALQNERARLAAQPRGDRPSHRASSRVRGAAA